MAHGCGERDGAPPEAEHGGAVVERGRVRGSDESDPRSSSLPAWLDDGPAVLLRRRHRPDQVEVFADLRRLLGDSGYAEEQIPQALGQDSRPFSRHPDFAVALSRLPESRLGALIKLFILGL